MEYDPIKDRVGSVFGRTPGLQKLFFRLLDLLLLRTWHVHRELRLWKKENPGHRHILDAGTGFGQYSYFMARKNPGWSILGVDVKKDLIARCNEFFRKLGRENVVFKTANLEEFYQSNAFDLILSVDVIEHILEDEQVFRNFCRSLKKGGMLLISTPSDQGGSDVSHEGDTSFIGEHVREGYNMNEIKEKLKNSGFSRVKARYSYGSPGKLSWQLSMKYPILMLNFSRAFFAVLPLYYLVVYPFCFLLNFLDSRSVHPTGSGLIVKAWK